MTITVPVRTVIRGVNLSRKRAFKALSLLLVDASDFGWGGHTLGCSTVIAHEYFSEWEAVQSSTYRELLGVTRCLQSLIEICKGKTVVVQVDAMNLLGIVNRGSPRLALDVVAREMF